MYLIFLSSKKLIVMYHDRILDLLSWLPVWFFRQIFLTKFFTWTHFFKKKRCVRKIISVFVLNICFLPSVLTGILRRESFSIIYSAYQFSLENNGTRAGVHWAPVPGKAWLFHKGKWLTKCNFFLTDMFYFNILVTFPTCLHLSLVFSISW